MAKILDIIPYKILPARMGGQKGIANFCKYLGQGNELTTISVDDNDATHAENYELIPLFTKKRSRYLNPFYVFRIKKIIKDKNIRNIITEHPYMSWMGWYQKKVTGINWFVHSHNIEFERFRTLQKPWYKLLKLYEAWAYRNADKVFFKTKEDIDFAVQNKMVKKENAVLVPFGIEIKEMPSDRLLHKKNIYSQFNIPDNDCLLFFNGALDYQPNTDALSFILNEINPLLLKEETLKYKILVCGRGLPSSFNDLKGYSDRNVIYAGFVDDIVACFKAADIFINPVVAGGGVKTKIVEAMAYGETVISCKTGAAGIDLSSCGKKIIIVDDNDAIAFTKSIVENTKKNIDTPLSYYENYYWGNIIEKILPLFK
ncbi:MAG: glycosyltransferase family 4 protein [Bacteroidetes bacterium]|nr:glycosyltransferase family 4 protein [Bacteroidota bacterium]